MTKRKITKNIVSFMFALATPFACLGALGATKNASAATETRIDYSSFESVTNGSFNDISSTYASGDFTGWSLLRGNTGATTMIIDVADNNSYNSSSVYYTSKLKNGNPGKKGGTADNKILMINEANSSHNPASDNYTPKNVHEGYKSSELTLQGNSFYTLQVSYKTDSFETFSSLGQASIYLSGLKNESGESITLSYEKISSTSWNTAYFFIATGDTEQKANLELWLGTKDQDSAGAAFFDEVYLQRYSENKFYEIYYNVENPYYSQDNFYYNVAKTNTDKNGNTYNYFGENEDYFESSRPLHALCELDEKVLINTAENLDFEKDNTGVLSTLVDWTKDDTISTAGAHAQVIDINDAGIFTNTIQNGYAYTGSTLSYNNNKALALWTDSGTTGVISLKNKNIKLKAHECIKVTAYVKVSALTSGAFELVAKENDTIFTSFPELTGRYKTKEVSASISSNGSLEANNNYAEATLYLQGHDQFDSSFNVFVRLGNKSTPAEGCVVVDDIRIEKVTFEEASKGSNTLKLNAYADQSSLSIPNANFNKGYSDSKNMTYPLSASDWTASKESNINNIHSGVVNLYGAYFDEFKAQNAWASSMTNPSEDPDDAKNAYLFQNGVESYQSIKSSEFTLNKNTYYSIDTKFLTQKAFPNTNADLTIDIFTNKGVLIYTDTISSLNNWTTYSANIFTSETDTTVYMVLSFGKQGATCQGNCFVQWVDFETTNEETFNSATHKADLSSLMLNLDPTNSVGENITSSLAYVGSSSEADGGNGGVIVGKNNNSFGHVKNNGEIVDSIDDGSLENNVLVVSTTKANTYTLTSNFQISISSKSYRKLSFRLLTSIGKSEQDASYGVSVGLKDLPLVENLIFNDGWTECTVYFYNPSDTSIDTNLVFKLTSIDDESLGYAYLTDLVWSEENTDHESYEKDFNAAANNDSLNKTLFTSTYVTEKQEETKEEEPKADSNNDRNTILTILIAISSGITGIALLVAIICYALRKVKIKKYKKTKIEAYDRHSLVDNNYIVDAANKAVKAQIAEIEASIEAFKQEIAELEEKQKKNIALSRKNEGKITSEIEKEFKSYSSKRAKIQDKLNILNEKLVNIKSPEYMVSLQRKIAIQKIKEKKAANKQVKTAKK